MKSRYFFLFSIIALASCSNESIIDANHAGLESKQTPIGFEINKGNISRVEARAKFEEIGHYNFGVWAYKYGGSLSDQKVMDNYLVGYSDESGNGYDHSKSTTWAGIAGSNSDYKSCWFYESLGKLEYTYDGTDGKGYYKNTDTKFMSANDYQYLRYWDLAYKSTNFYAYAPYKSSGVTLDYTNNGAATMTFEKGVLQSGYDYTPDTKFENASPKQDRTLSQNMYACVRATNGNKQDVSVRFNHMGAQLFIRFYEEIPGYRVEIINLGDDGGNMVSTATEDQKQGIQATPSKKSGESYSLGNYYKTCGGTVTFTADANASYNPAWESTAETTQENLMFFAPSTDNNDYATTNVPEAYKSSASNLTISDAQNVGTGAVTHYVIPEKVTTGSDQTYAWSPTIYYPVAQPTTSETGFNFHVSYRIISDDNKEVTTVHNATVFVPATSTTTSTSYIAAWQPATRYIYTFKITKNSTGTTNPFDNIDPTDPTPSTTKSLYPIVFDEVTIEDYSESKSDHDISEGTNY